MVRTDEETVRTGATSFVVCKGYLQWVDRSHPVGASHQPVGLN